MRLKIENKYVYIEEIVIITLFLCVLSRKARMFLSRTATEAGKATAAKSGIATP